MLLCHGQIPAGMHVLHNCDNPSCVNVEHLRFGTHADNMEDMATRKRYKAPRFQGEAHPNSKLCEGSVFVIKLLARMGESKRAIARRFQVHSGTICKVLSGENWSHLR